MNKDRKKLSKRNRESARFILSLQLSLLQKALAPWPRRGAQLLEINCGDGAYLPFLWQSGFEISATEANPDLRMQAHAHGYDIEIRAARDDSLPFEDDYFDWAILHLMPCKEEKLETSLQECLRVSRKGLLISFWNSSSLPCLCWRLSHRQPWPPKALALFNVLREMRHLRMGTLTVMSTLCGPFCSWRERKAFKIMNSSLNFLPIGAWCLARLDLARPRLVTPLRLSLENVMPSAMPVMEYSERKYSQKHN